MTDSRLPARWLSDLRFEELSDRAFRTFAGSLMWSNEQGTDGLIPARAMKFLHPEGVDAATRTELVNASLWHSQGKDVQVPDWSSSMGQSKAEHVAAKREANRERQTKHRAKTKGEPVTFASEVTHDVTRDITRESLGEDRTGEERQGQAKYLEDSTSEESHVNLSTGEVFDASDHGFEVKREGGKVRLERVAS